MALSVQEILDLDIPSPSLSYRPSHATPSRSNIKGLSAGSGFAYDTRDGLFRDFGADKVAIDGDDAAARNSYAGTNEVLLSSNIDYETTTEWSGFGIDITNRGPSIFDDPDAVGVKCSATGNTGDSQVGLAGTMSGGPEAFYGIIEEGNSDITEISISSTSGEVARIGVNFDSQISVEKRPLKPDYADFIKLSDSGPNGGRVVLAVASYGGGQGNNNSGEDRTVVMRPDAQDGTNASIFHHVQIMETGLRGVHMPKITKGTAKTIDGRVVRLVIDPSWFNNNEGTYIFDQTPYYLQKNTFNFPGIIFPNAKIEWEGGSPFRIKATESNGSVYPNEIIPFNQRFKTVLTYTENSFDFAVNGSVDSNNPHDGTFGPSLVDGNAIEFLGDQLVHSITYIPRKVSADTARILSS